MDSNRHLFRQMTLLLLVAAPVAAQPSNAVEIVRAAKDAVIARGTVVDALDECNRFEVTKEAARRLAALDPEAGLLAKPSGNNCDGYAVDIIAYKNGQVFDVLGAGPEGPNTPQFIPLGPVDATRWRPPIGSAPNTPPAPTPVPQPPNVVIVPSQTEGILLTKVDALAARVEQLYALEAEQTRADGDAHASINQNITDGRAENKSAWDTVKPVFEFVGKYVAPAVTAWLLAKHTS